MKTIPQFDSTRYYLGSLCKRNHNWPGTEKSLRNHHSRDCLECVRVRNKKLVKRGLYKKQWESHRAFVDKIKLERGCADCGYDSHPAALHFDHLPGESKKYGISRMANKSEEAVLEEMDKCEVVCANCHAIRTATRLSVTATTQTT